MRRTAIINKYFLLILISIVLLLINICNGSVSIGLKDVINTFFSNQSSGVYSDIVLKIRFPRALGAFLIGGALSLSGYSLQTFFRNPIAGPYILGISSGAKLAVALLFVFASRTMGQNYIVMIAVSFLGALLSIGFVLLCSKRLNNMAMLLVCGVMIGYICTAITDFVVTFANDSDIVNLHNWSRGSLSGLGWNEVECLGIVIVCISLVVFLLSKPMGAYLMGETYAKSLGVNIKLFRIFLVLASSILAAVVTAFVGPVSFVGIAVPHLARGLMKDSKPLVLVPATFLFGGAFTLLCDFIARTVFAPTELSISTVTAVFGAPIVIALLIRNRIGK